MWNPIHFLYQRHNYCSRSHNRKVESETLLVTRSLKFLSRTTKFFYDPCCEINTSERLGKQFRHILISVCWINLKKKQNSSPPRALFSWLWEVIYLSINVLRWVHSEEISWNMMFSTLRRRKKGWLQIMDVKLIHFFKFYPLFRGCEDRKHGLNKVGRGLKPWRNLRSCLSAILLP